MKPYQVWWKRFGGWRMVFDTHTPSEAHEYARDRVAHGGITERIEVRDLTGVLSTVFDASWVRP